MGLSYLVSNGGNINMDWLCKLETETPNRFCFWLTFLPFLKLSLAPNLLKSIENKQAQEVHNEIHTHTRMHARTEEHWPNA